MQEDQKCGSQLWWVYCNALLHCQVFVLVYIPTYIQCIRYGGYISYIHTYIRTYCRSVVHVLTSI